MGRREIRQMLTTPRRTIWHRKGFVPALMLLVLAVGLGLGLAIGEFAGKPAKRTAPETIAEFDRPPRREAEPAEPAVVPILPLPKPRPEAGEAETATEPPPTEPVTEPVTGPEGEQEASVPPILPQAPVKPTGFGTPAWLRYAVPAPRTAGHPMIAVVIDDMGVDRRRAEKVVGLRAPLTLAFMTYAEDLPRQTALARAKGHELMLHVPMQPMGESYDPGPDVLEANLSPEEIHRRLVWGLGRFDGFVGINNHMGSRFTSDRPGMRIVMEELKRRGLLWFDSLTSGKTVGMEMAARYGVPGAARDVFLDNTQTVAAVRAQLAKVEAVARSRGMAIAIGHPHDATIQALSEWLPGLEAKGFVLVPLTAIVKAKTKTP